MVLVTGAMVTLGAIVGSLPSPAPDERAGSPRPGTVDADDAGTVELPGAAEGPLADDRGGTTPPGPDPSTPVPDEETERSSDDGRARCAGCDRWRLDVRGSITSATKQGELLTVATTGGWIRAVQADRGTVRWATRLGDEPVTAMPVDELVAVASTSGRVAALDAATGATRWDVHLGVAGDGAGLVGGGSAGVLVLVGPPSAPVMVALDATDGHERWRRRIEGHWTAVDGGVVTAVDGALQRWSIEDPGPSWSRPLEPQQDLVGPAGGAVVVSGADGSRWLDATDGSVRLEVPRGLSSWTTTAEGRVFTASTATRPQVRAFGPDGDQRWQTRLPEAAARIGCCVEVTTTPAGEVLAIDRRGPGAAFLLDPDTGEVLEDLPLGDGISGWSLLGVLDGLAVVRDRRDINGIDLATGSPRWRVTAARSVVSLDPLVVASRRTLLAPETGDRAAGATRSGAGSTRARWAVPEQQPSYRSMDDIGVDGSPRWWDEPSGDHRP